MKSYMVIGQSVTVHTGDIALNQEQATRRKNLVNETINSGVFEIKSPIIFKKGEKFGYDGDLDKATAIHLKEGVKRPGRPPRAR